MTDTFAIVPPVLRPEEGLSIGNYKAQILADSVSPQGIRLTTFQVQFPRFILAEVNTHRIFSRNSASSRAIPIAKQIAKVRANPFVPIGFGSAQKGMQSGENLSGVKSWLATQVWLKARYAAIGAAKLLDKLNVHKQFANRLLEPWMWHTAIISSTEWSNFFALRTDKMAQPEFRRIAVMMRSLYLGHDPIPLTDSQWHLPLVSLEELYGPGNSYINLSTIAYWVKVSIGRCARVSYLTHDGKRDPEADIELYERLKTSGHLSPFEHAARPFTLNEWQAISGLQQRVPFFLSRAKQAEMVSGLEFSGNFRGWHAARKDIENESDFSLAVAA